MVPLDGYGEDAIPELWQQLIAAAAQNNVITLRALVSRGTGIDVKDGQGWTLLHYAAFNGALKCVRFLIDAGANVRCTNDIGKTPADLAAAADNRGIFELLNQQTANNSEQASTGNGIKPKRSSGNSAEQSGTER